MIRQYIDRQLKELNTEVFIRCLKIFSVVGLGISLYALIFSGFQIVDEFEHLHASWLISIGKVPYVDFFEHHHPLLWYVSAPIVGLFYDNVAVFYVMRGISLIFSLLTLWYLYQIVLFWGDKKSAWLAIALALGNIITLYNIYQFRPDNFMNLGFIAGLYYLLLYLKKLSLKYLILSFLSFTFSLLFLQKISFLLVIVECILLWLLATKKISLKDVTLSALPAVGILFIFLGYLTYKQALPEYLELNFRFNQALVYYFERGAFWYQRLWLSVYGFALLTAIYFYNKENIYFKIIAIIYLCEFILRAFYFAPHPNYYTLLTYLAAVILSVYAKILMPRFKKISALLIFALFLNLGHLFNKIDASSSKYNSYQHYLLADYVHQNSDATDYLMNGYDKNFNIYRQDVSYYWFGLDMLLPIIKQEYDIKEDIDVNTLILQYRPKFIYTENYVDLRALRTYGERRYTQVFIPEIVNALYNKTPFEHLAVLK